MSFVHGKSSQILAEGYDISEFLNKIDVNKVADVVETSTYAPGVVKVPKQFIGGLINANLTADGFYAHNEITQDQIDNIMDDIFGGTANICWYPEGAGYSKSGFGIYCINTTYSIMGTLDQAVKISIAGQSNVGREALKSLHPLTQVTSDGSGTVVDLGTGGINGGAAYLHITQITGTVSEIKIEHSSDNNTFTTLATFTDPTNIGSQRITFTGVVNRYVKITYAGTAFTMTFQAGINKK